MSIEFLIERFIDHKDNVAIIYNGVETRYEELVEQINTWESRLADKVTPGSVVALQGDFTPQSIAALIALIKKQCIVVPLMLKANLDNLNANLEIAQTQWHIVVKEDETHEIIEKPYNATHTILEQLKADNKPGLILFTSGSSGVPKATTHDFSKLLEKFKKLRDTKRILNFLLFDHWGGLNTMFHILAGAGTLISVQNRDPDSVCKCIEANKIQILPASPTFLNLVLLSGANKRYDLSSLELITYGTEPMQENTLKALNEHFPQTKLQQTYGLIELGVMSSKSKSADSLWVKLGGQGFEWRVVDNILQIKAHSAMLGYLNAPSPFTDDGWFITGDYVEQDGEYLRIFGRKSEIINVGGEKVFPIEVENVIQSMDNVLEATVYPMNHAITGKIVCTKVHLENPEDKKAFKDRLKRYCAERLAAFKVPVKISISDEAQMSYRLKKSRTLNQSNPE